MTTISSLPQRRQDGVALLEALIAAVLLAIGLLGTVGLQARAQAALADAGIRAEATIAAERLLGIMTVDAAHLSDYVINGKCADNDTLKLWCQDLNNSLPVENVKITVTPGATGEPKQVDMSITWKGRAGAAANRHDLTAYI